MQSESTPSRSCRVPPDGALVKRTSVSSRGTGSVTFYAGSNLLVGNNVEWLKVTIEDVFRGAKKTKDVPPLWDGKAGSRIAQIISTGT